MIHPPHYPDYVEPSEPRWRHWWLALLLLWGTQSALLIALWPEQRPKVELWLWSAVLPMLWALALTLRNLVWQIGLGNRDAYRGVIDASLQRWWRKRSRGLPVERVVLFGPAGERQAHYARLMAGTAPLPQSQVPSAGAPEVLRCPVSSNLATPRAPLVAKYLARILQTQDELVERWPHLRGVAWGGSTESYQTFASVLGVAGVSLPEQALELNDLTALDRLIDRFPTLCPEVDDWLLCAGVASIDHASEGQMAGEGAFAWIASHAGKTLLKRGEYLLDETPAELCSQVQRYGGLKAPPKACLAMDTQCMSAFVEGGWSANEHLLAAHWGVLEHLAPFMGMSIALLHSANAGEVCGWLSTDGVNRLAMGMAVPHGEK